MIGADWFGVQPALGAPMDFLLGVVWTLCMLAIGGMLVAGPKILEFVDDYCD
jgi:hypothetical protein